MVTVGGRRTRRSPDGKSQPEPEERSDGSDLRQQRDLRRQLTDGRPAPWRAPLVGGEVRKSARAPEGPARAALQHDPVRGGTG